MRHKSKFHKRHKKVGDQWEFFDRGLSSSLLLDDDDDRIRSLGGTWNEKEYLFIKAFLNSY